EAPDGRGGPDAGGGAHPDLGLHQQPGQADQPVGERSLERPGAARERSRAPLNAGGGPHPGPHRARTGEGFARRASSGLPSAFESGLDRLARLLAGGPEVGSTSRYGAVSRLARRAVLRATRLGANHQQEVDQAIIEALRSVAAAGDGEHRHLTARLNALEVELASALRALAEVPRGRSRGAPAEGWRTMLLRLLEPGAPPLPLGSAREGVAEVETDVGSLLLPAHDRVVLPILAGSGTWEPDESALIDRKLGAGMTAVDLGAHVGYLTIRAARAVGATGRVIAVEPAPLNFALLNANLRRNGFANVLTIPAAAWRKSGTARLEVDPYNTGDHRVFQVDRRDAHVEVPALALDDLLPEE